MFHFYTENIRKTLVFWRFQGIYKWNTGLKWVKNKVNYAPFLIIPFDLVNQYLQHNLVYKRYNIFNISKCILFYFFFSVNTNYNRHYQGLKKDNHHSILDNDCCINRNFGKILCYVKYTIHLIKWNWTEAYFSLRKRCPFLFRIFRVWIKYGELLCKSPYSIRMPENADHKNSRYGHFTRSVYSNGFQFSQHNTGNCWNTGEHG